MEAARERWIPHGTPAFRALLRWTDVVSGAGYGVLYEAAALRRAARARQVRER